MKRSLRGLYVIRSGVALAPILRAKKAEEEAPAETKKEDSSGGLGTLEVNFSKYNEWYRIDSFWEGTFLERTAPGAFKKTLAERGGQTKILFNHGMDFNIGDKVLAMPEEYGDRKDSPYLAGELLDTSYNRDLFPALERGAYGSSFMFEVLGETWDNEPEKSADNPDGLPERTISEVRLFEAGPVTWPANPGATAGMRCGTDWYLERALERDPEQREDLVRSFKAFRTLNDLQPFDTPPAPPTPDEGRHAAGLTKSARQRRLTLLTMER